MKMELQCGIYSSGSGKDSDPGSLWIQ